MQLRTLSRRILCSELVSVARLCGRRSVQALAGNLEEIGESSALILTEAAVPPGTKVRVKGEATELKGFVKSCTSDRLLGFFIEIGLDAESCWSEKWFVPEQLLALCPSMRYFTHPLSKVPEKFFPGKTCTRLNWV
jgi:hypothetical protein